MGAGTGPKASSAGGELRWHPACLFWTVIITGAYVIPRQKCLAELADAMRAQSDAAVVARR
jgi:hypothetical protein